MQTFLPYKCFVESAKVLDNKRLGKQRVEVLQLLQGSWSNHPASKMWRGYTNCLVAYGLTICHEWLDRGFKDTCFEKIKAFYRFSESLNHPAWLGNKEFHLSHQSNLLRKDFEHYSKFFPGVPVHLAYIWPTN